MPNWIGPLLALVVLVGFIGFAFRQGMKVAPDRDNPDNFPTAKSCGPDTPTLVSSLRSCVGPTGLRQNISADDGGKRARSPGRARRKPLKPLRAGMPGDSGVLVVTRVRSTTTKCTRGRGCNGHPAFPTPSFGRKMSAQLGRIAPRGREVASGIRVPSLRAKRSDPDAVIPGWSAGPDPESRDSGFDAPHRPGMTESGFASRSFFSPTRWPSQ
jgi:hypothetical protein